MEVFKKIITYTYFVVVKKRKKKKKEEKSSRSKHNVERKTRCFRFRDDGDESSQNWGVFAFRKFLFDTGEAE